MASLRIIFVKRLPKDGTLYTPTKRVAEMVVTARKMTKSWLKKNYGPDNDIREMYYARSPKMWLTCRYSERFGKSWDVCNLGNERLCDKPYDYIVVM